METRITKGLCYCGDSGHLPNFRSQFELFSQINLCFFYSGFCLRTPAASMKWSDWNECMVVPCNPVLPVNSLKCSYLKMLHTGTGDWLLADLAQNPSFTVNLKTHRKSNSNYNQGVCVCVWSCMSAPTTVRVTKRLLCRSTVQSPGLFTHAIVSRGPIRQALLGK